MPCFIGWLEFVTKATDYQRMNMLYAYCSNSLRIRGYSVGISIWQLLIVLAIVLVLFGAKRMRGLGSDLGTAIRGFKQAIRDDESSPEGIISPASAKAEESTHV